MRKIFMSGALKRHFVSELDDFLQVFDQTHEKKSLSQQKEITKHQRIAQLRDGVSAINLVKEDKEIWEDF